MTDYRAKRVPLADCAALFRPTPPLRRRLVRRQRPAQRVVRSLARRGGPHLGIVANRRLTHLRPPRRARARSAVKQPSPVAHGTSGMASNRLKTVAIPPSGRLFRASRGRRPSGHPRRPRPRRERLSCILSDRRSRRQPARSARRRPLDRGDGAEPAVCGHRGPRSEPRLAFRRRLGVGQPMPLSSSRDRVVRLRRLAALRRISRSNAFTAEGGSARCPPILIPAQMILIDLVSIMAPRTLAIRKLTASSDNGLKHRFLVDVTATATASRSAG
jgi:hypothetical protein